MDCSRKQTGINRYFTTPGYRQYKQQIKVSFEAKSFHEQYQ